MVFLTLSAIGCSWEDFVYDKKPIAAKLEPVGYSKDGFTFDHPGRWTITDETDKEGYRQLYIGDAFSSYINITIAPEGMEYDLGTVAKETLNEFRKSMPVGEVKPPKVSQIFRLISSNRIEGIRHNYDYRVIGISVPYTTDYFLVNLAGRESIIIVSAADEDWPAAKQEFAMILDSIDLSLRKAAER